MNKFFAIFLIFLSYNSFSQNKESFEGIILYENTFKSKIDSISSSHFENAYGKQTKYILAKNGDYLNLFKGSYITVQLYKNKEDNIYTVLTNRDTIFYNKVTEKKGDISNLKTSLEETIILDKNCIEISFETETSKYKYFYNNDYFEIGRASCRVRV